MPNLQSITLHTKLFEPRYYLSNLPLIVPCRVSDFINYMIELPSIGGNAIRRSFIHKANSRSSLQFRALRASVQTPVLLKLVTC